MGIKGGWRRGSKFDRSSTYGSLTLYSTPEGWLGMMLIIIFAVYLQWFPVSGYDSGGDLTGINHVVDVLNHLVLPAATLALGYGASYMIVMRSSLIEVKDEDFIGAVRAHGLTESMIRRRHGIPNAFLPSFTSDRAEFRLRARRRNRHRNGVQLPGNRSADVSRDRCVRLSRAARCVPHQQHRRRDRQPDRGPDVRLP